MAVKICSDEMKSIILYEGLMTRRRVYCELSSLTLTKIKPGAELKLHSHKQEQIGFVLEGEAEFTVGEGSEQTKIKIKSGDFFAFKSNTPHGVRVNGDKDLLFIDLYTPVEEIHKSGAYQLGSI